MRVSIPHRFNSHLYHLVVLVDMETRFNPSQVQFTLWGGWNVVRLYLSFNPSQVQFTPNTFINLLKEIEKFQSLTGSIHTFIQRCFDYQTRLVSIPHRFNSHQVFLQIRFREFESFNPSQVQFTQNNPNTLLTSPSLFQSLTGSIHTFIVHNIAQHSS